MVFESKPKPLISFCTPVFGDQDSIEAMVESIKDQDYPNIEHIICVDGCKKSEKVVKKIVKKYPDIKAIYLKENKGACIARNEGAKLAKGKYFSFLPADAKLYPGVVRVWIDHLEENPDYDFVYGGYKLVGPGGFDYMSEPFDPYILEAHNYIDGSFPIRATTFLRANGWDPNIKSLQDWDLWLTVVKDLGRKGVYVRDVFFETTMPHKGGLSHDSSTHWIERTETIKKKHNIPLRKICVSALAAPFHGKRVARMLDADFSEMPSFKPHKYEIVYQVGFFPQMADLCGQVFANCRGKKIVHWIGTDIWQLAQMNILHRQMLMKWMDGHVDEHFAEADFTQKELRELGINASIVPLPPRFLYPLMPRPEKYTVAVYQPMNNKNFYLPELCTKVAKLCPDIEFKFFGDDMTVGRDNNIEYCGYIENMEKFIESCSAIMRLTVHDGLPISVLEFILAGRDAITTAPVEYATNVSGSWTAELVADTLKRMQTLKLNAEGSDYWRKILDHEKFKETLYSHLEYKPKEYWEKHAERWSELADQGYSLNKEEFEIIQGLLEKTSYESVIDLGCGNSRFLRLFNGKEYHGVDISQGLINICKKRYPDLSYEITKIEDYEPKKKYDLAWCYTTLEHIKDVDIEKAITKIKKAAHKLILIEPYGFDSIYYCYNHPYEKYFKILEQHDVFNKRIYLIDLDAS